MILKVKQKTVNRITLYTQFNYALKNWYGIDFYGEPEETGTSCNTHIRFNSPEPGTATVDWGDGQQEVFDFIERTAGDYICAWRSLNIDYVKDPAAANKGWGLGRNKKTNEIIIPYPNHYYEDGDKNAKRKITITFSNQITQFYSNVNEMVEFPLIELPTLTALYLSNTKNIKEIPIDRIAKLTDLKTLQLSALGSTLQIIPESIFQLTNLTSMVLNSIVNLSNVEASNIRKIKNLRNLETVQLMSCYLPNYLKEFNQLPNLKTLYIGNANLLPDSPSFEEVSQINTSLTTFNWLMGNGNVLDKRTNWGEQVSGKGIHNLVSLTVTHARELSLILPEYIKEMRSLNTFNISSSLENHLRIDTFVNNFYEYILNWELITMNSIATDKNRNQFYSLKVNTYNASFPTYANTPSGILQAPEGFVQGVNNGTPTTPMEKIYVLTQNYKQTWEIKPEETTTRTARSPRQLEYNQIIDNTMVVSHEGVEYKNEIVTLTDKELEQIEQNN